MIIFISTFSSLRNYCQVKDFLVCTRVSMTHLHSLPCGMDWNRNHEVSTAEPFSYSLFYPQCTIRSEGPFEHGAFIYCLTIALYITLFSAHWRAAPRNSSGFQSYRTFTPWIYQNRSLICSSPFLAYCPSHSTSLSKSHTSRFCSVQHSWSIYFLMNLSLCIRPNTEI